MREWSDARGGWMRFGLGAQGLRWNAKWGVHVVGLPGPGSRSGVFLIHAERLCLCGAEGFREISAGLLAKERMLSQPEWERPVT